LTGVRSKNTLAGKAAPLDLKGGGGWSMRPVKALAWACACWASVGVADASRVRVEVVDEATGRPVPARAYLWRGRAPVLPEGFSSYSRGDELHFLVPGDFELDLAAGKYTLRLERGLEYLPAEVDLGVPREAPVPIRLRRWIDMRAAGWYAADMHVHRDPAEMPLILGAEDLDFVPTITTHVWSNDVSRPWKSPTEFPVRVEPGRLFTGNSQEIERIQGGPGAVILLARDLPLPFDGYEYYPPSVTYTRKVHELGGYVEGDKPFWVDTFVNAALGQLDFIELNCNHFLPRLVDTDLVPWSHWPVELGYRGNRGFALWMMDLYYRILNSGIELPLSAGSANGVKATPAGYDRVYVRLGKGKLDYPAFMAALKKGRSFSTNGPIVDLVVDGAYGPGDRIAVERPEEHRFQARGRSRGPLESLELVVDGAVVASRKGQDARELTLDKTLRLDRSSWAAVRAFEKSERSEVFAHTSPVYFTRKGKPVVVPSSVRDLLQKIDSLIASTEKLDGFRDERHRKETLDVYREARQVLARRMH
jgi:TolB protein